MISHLGPSRDRLKAKDPNCAAGQAPRPTWSKGR
jgi:hypothetical protein